MKRLSSIWLTALAVCLSACGSGTATRAADTTARAAVPEAALAELYAQRSMLQQAAAYSARVSGSPRQWSGPYMSPQPETLTRIAADYLTLYPRTYAPKQGRSVLGTLCEPGLWDALARIGFTLVHPLTFEQAGRVRGREVVESIDGGFDRISYEVEPSLGTEAELRQLVQTAREHGALIVGDVIPLHSGLGYDFRLAEMNQAPYPGMYDMIEIPQRAWALLPDVPDRWGVAVISREQARALIGAGYMPGRIEVLVGSEASVNWSGWAATAEVPGVDGKPHRWIYAHLFEAEQPKYNWMDPSYAGRRSQTGDLVRQVVGLGLRMQRLDAVPFLGLEPQRGSDQLRHYMTALAIAGTNDLAYTARKLGTWTWVELNVPIAAYHDFMEHGADFGYDFFTRAETLHPLITGDARLLRQAHRALLSAGVQHSGLIHSLQNHDEITYQMVDLRARENVRYGHELLKGSELADRVLAQAQRAVTGEAAPYNLLYRPQRDGIATTYAGFIAPTLGVDPYAASPAQVESIKHTHVMLAHVTALQPGIFSLSQWDLVGALPLARSQVAKRLAGGDVRWVNRGAVDLMGEAAGDASAAPLPRAQSLYGPLPKQLQDPSSFASQVARMIHARKAYGIAQATVIAVPELDTDALCALVLALPADVGGIAVTVANYGRAAASLRVDLADVQPISGQVAGAPRDILTEKAAGDLNDQRSLVLELDGLSARTVAIGALQRRQPVSQPR